MRTENGRIDSVSIRLPNEDDERAFLEAVQRIKGFHAGWVNPPDTAPAFKQYLDRIKIADFEGFLVCVGDDLAGVVNINNIVRGALQSGYLGYYAFAGFEGRGNLKRGLRLVLDHAFHGLELHRLEANIQPMNSASLGLAMASGFVREGFSAKYLFLDGESRDHERLAITSDMHT